MRTTASIALALAALAVLPGVAGAAAPRVETMVVGQTRVLGPAETVPAAKATLKVGRERCAVAAGTPLAALQGLRADGGPAFTLRDFGSCSRRTADAASLYVDRIGSEKARGTDGWVYKIDNRVGTAGAGDRGGPFGRGPLKRGQRVLWFWCRQTGGDTCQPTLGLTATEGAGSVRIVVTAYDDQGRGTLRPSARVAVGDLIGETGPDGAASFPLPPGGYTATASAPGASEGFPLEVTVR